MGQLFSLSTLSFVIGLAFAAMVIFYRLRLTKQPISARKIVLPPFMMATGFLMFHFPGVETPLSYDFIAFVVGMVLSIPLILSTHFEVVGKEVYLKKSNAFIAILLTMFVFRLLVKIWVGDVFTPLQTAGLFFVLAFGMIIPWRVAMLIMYRQVTKNHPCT